MVFTSFICILWVVLCTGRVAAERDVSDWIILGLDVPNYANGLCRKVPRSERSWIRHYKMEVRWEKVQPARGKFDWSYYDRQVNAALNDGARSILFLVGGPVPVWARDPKYGEFAGKAPPKNLRDWYDFCMSLAERYGEVVDFYEIWNEPGWDRDSEAFRRFNVFHFGGQVEKDYLQLIRLAYAAIKKADPTAKVICGALINSYIENPDEGGELYGYLFGDYELPGRGVSVRLSSESPITAERVVGFTYGQACYQDTHEGDEGSDSWYFLAPGVSSRKKTFLVLTNQSEEDTWVSVSLGEGSDNGIFLELPVARASLSTVCLPDGDGEKIGEPCGEIIKVFSENPVSACLHVYLEDGTRGHAEMMDDESAEVISLEGSGSDYELREELLLYNPNRETADVRIRYRNETKEEVTSTLSLEAFNYHVLALERDIRRLYESALSESELSIEAIADMPILAQRNLVFSFPGRWYGQARFEGMEFPATEWRLPVSAEDYSVREYLVLKNEGQVQTQVNLDFFAQDICFRNASELLAPSCEKAFNLKTWLGLATYCDMIAVHPYGLPELWGAFYGKLNAFLQGMGLKKELVVTEIGWPHYAENAPQAYSETGQAEALSSKGLDGLWAAGCKKIWVYKDMDEPPGRSWDKTYFGLFRYDGTPHPAWAKYKERQAANPDYPILQQVQR
jgi:hypothetical protein